MMRGKRERKKDKKSVLELLIRLGLCQHGRTLSLREEPVSSWPV